VTELELTIGTCRFQKEWGSTFMVGAPYKVSAQRSSPWQRIPSNGAGACFAATRLSIDENKQVQESNHSTIARNVFFTYV